MGQAEVRLSPCFKDCTDIYSALSALLNSIQPGDYFALNAFLPFTGEGRREALEQIRHGVADKRGVASCLEVGPRYLHSTGQLQKGPGSGSRGDHEDLYARAGRPRDPRDLRHRGPSR